MSTVPSDDLRAVVFGAAGYVGGELLRLLSQHPHVAEVVGVSESHAGEPWHVAHPTLRHVTPRREPARFAAASDVEVEPADLVFAALPHGESQNRMGDWLAADPALVVDLGADFRVQDPELYARHYGEHTATDLVSAFQYALADVRGSELSGARALAAPGCFATASLLALRVAAMAGPWAATPTVFGVTGSSGSGARPKATTHHAFRSQNFFAYGSTGHRHEAEIDEQVRAWTGDEGAHVHLLPHSSPLVRGIHATCVVPLEEACGDPLGPAREAFPENAFVHVLDTPPRLADVLHTNHAHLNAALRDNGHTLVVHCAIDNLVKGAAGQAVQAANLALGWDETAGLTAPGASPC